MILTITVLLALGVATDGKLQSFCAEGFLKCDQEEHAVNQVVELKDADAGPNPDDAMGGTLTDASGYFSLCGNATDIIGTIEPTLVIYTACNLENEDETCEREITIPISKDNLPQGRYRFSSPIDLNQKPVQLTIPGRESRERVQCSGQGVVSRTREALSRWGQDYKEKLAGLMRKIVDV